MSDSPKLNIPTKLNRKDLAEIFFRRLRASFTESGWLESALIKRAMDADGAPLPWYTYPSIYFLGPRIQPTWTVFEYGCGQSTLWWAAKVARLTAVEHDQAWAETMRERVPANCSIVYRELEYGGDYGREILQYRDTLFDVVVVDGRDRVNSARNSLERLAPAGVIVWDNADREYYRDGHDHLHANGFRRLDFHGYGPCNTKPWLTSVFYRAENCLGI